MPAFIVIEGLKGTGKTTVAKQLVKSIGGVFTKTPPDELEEERAWFMGHNPTPEMCWEYFRGLVTASSALIRAQQNAGYAVVSDRYWYSTIAVNKAAGAETSARHFAGLLEPDLIVYLKAHNAIRQKHLQEREAPVFPGKAAGDAWDAARVSDKALEQTFDELFQKRGLPKVLTIDTSSLTVAQVVEIIQGKILM
jgi:thymidylate kinase